MHRLSTALGILILFSVAPASAQEAVVVDQGGQTDMNTGGDQFPEGTQNCGGSRRHHAHDYPGRLTCSKFVNPHYSTTKGSEPCTRRSKDECGCEDCCRKQTAETKTCFCMGSKQCKAGADYTENVCNGTCLAEYLDRCPDDNFTEPGPGQG